MNKKKRKKNMNEEKVMQEQTEETKETEPQQEAPQEEQQPSETEIKLAEAEKLRDEYLNLAQRVQADFDNFRRRNASVRADSFDDGARTFAATILPVIDNLERALAAAENTTDEALKSGVEMTLRQLLEAFNKRGIEEIVCLGQKFDPNLENAVMQGTAEEGEPGTVCAVFQKGYKMGNFVLRHAMVKVVAE